MARGNVKRTCEHCETTFFTHNCYIRRGGGRFCSLACRDAAKIRSIIDNGDGTATIPLTKGMSATIDSVDIPRVEGRNWRPFWNGYKWYVVSGSRGITYLHRVLMDASDGVEIDHIDGDGFNNRRSTNLRVCTRPENGKNLRLGSSNTSGYKGVSSREHGRRWEASITTDGNYRYLGRFPSAEDAARAYDRAAKELHGEFARLNFPDES